MLDASLETALSAAGHAALDDPLFLGVDFLIRAGVAVEMLDQLKEKILRDSMSYVMDVVAALTEIHIQPQVAGPPPLAAPKPSSLKKGNRDSKPAPPSEAATAAVLSATSHIGWWGVRCAPRAGAACTLIVCPVFSRSFTFLGDAAFTSCFVNCMTCVANWNDGVSFRRWTSMWLRVFRLLAPAPQLADMFAGTVFKLATEALLMQKPWTLVRHSFF